MSKKKEIPVSPLAKTWILDLDGTIVVHNVRLTQSPGSTELLLH